MNVRLWLRIVRPETCLSADCSGDVLIAGREDTATAPAFLASLKIPSSGPDFP